jgi:hypothetical protein
MCIPYEDLLKNKGIWIRRIASFLEVPCTEATVLEVIRYSSKEWMLSQVDKFDESWCRRQRELIGREHPTITQAAPKVTRGHDDLREELDDAINTLNTEKWNQIMLPVTHCATYSEFSKLMCDVWNKYER